MGILVADSGGTKTDWVFLNDNGLMHFSGSGLHPAYMSGDDITEEIRRTVSVQPSQIYFYGAGCHGPEPVSKIKGAIQQAFPDAFVTVRDDLTGVARAHLQKSGGLIVALGTGSICGRYEDGEILRRSAALGYAIGDEGSAADLGRILLKAYFRQTLNKNTADTVAERLQHVTYSDCMDKIYGSSRPNKELASIAGMVLDGPLTNQLSELISSRFLAFIDSQFESLQPGNEERIVCSGSVAIAHGGALKQAFSHRGYERVSIKKDVIGGLARYHSAGE